jgi:SAM-dependent methyltransferase
MSPFSAVASTTRDSVHAAKRLLALSRNAGFKSTLTFLASTLDDRYLRSFDREYHVHTSGFIDLAQTSFTRSRLDDATLYGPVNGWAFRRLLQQLHLPREQRFVDLGCGLGRACILAAEYGFERVTGIDLATDLCAQARANIAASRIPPQARSAITVLAMDALNYCERSDDDIFFMYRPFERDFFSRILSTMKARARARQRQLTVIYTERVALPGSFFHMLVEDPSFRPVFETACWAQDFHVYQCGA